MRRVYVGTILSNGDTLPPSEYLVNLRRSMVLGNAIRDLGFAPFIPGLDILGCFASGVFNYKALFNASQAWLEASDILYLDQGYEDSKGAKAEKARAMELHIPIVYSLLELQDVGRALDEAD